MPDKSGPLLQTWTKEQALPWLIAARDSGHLVPFVGAGMCRPFCVGWVDFVRNLCGRLGHGQEAGKLNSSTNPEQLYRIADRVASKLRLLTTERRHGELVGALRPDSSDKSVPPQLAALMAFSWPLIITTNYDDLVCAAVKRKNEESIEKIYLPIPRVLGRSTRHCTEVVRSLDNLTSPIVWHVQGHLSVVGGDWSPDPDHADHVAFINQVVLGHQQYQQAINAEPIFRRAFAEIFRRRSLLFLGSGLAESYVVNLISEALFDFGPSPRSHYALLTRAEAERIDTEFLTMRLGITPVVYGDSHAELPHFIGEITKHPDHSGTSLASVIFKVKPKQQVDQVEVCISKSDLPSPRAERQTDHCVVVSIGGFYKSGKFQPYLCGPQVSSFLGQYGAVASRKDCLPVTDLDRLRVFRFVQDGREHPVFFAASTAVEASSEDDIRDLQTISDVTAEALKAAADSGFSSVSMGLIGAGDRAPYSKAHCLLAQLSGIRAYLEQYREQAVSLRRIEIHIRDNAAWLALAHGRIPAAELLSSGLARVLVRIVDVQGECEEFAVSVPHLSTVEKVLRGYQIGGLDSVNLKIEPITTATLTDKLKFRVFPGMVVEVSPAANAVPDENTSNQSKRIPGAPRVRQRSR